MNTLYISHMRETCDICFSASGLLPYHGLQFYVFLQMTQCYFFLKLNKIKVVCVCLPATFSLSIYLLIAIYTEAVGWLLSQTQSVGICVA